MTAILRGLVALSALAMACGSEKNTPPAPIPSVTFDLKNGGDDTAYLHQACLIDVTLTELTAPPHVIAFSPGCPTVCPCGATVCHPVYCGACFDGAVAVAADTTYSFAWPAEEITYEVRAGNTCSQRRLLPPGHYRIDVPVYPSPADAEAKTNARVVSQPFDLPVDEVIVTL